MEHTYSETLKLMKDVSKEEYDSNKRRYFIIITQHLLHLMEENPWELILYLKKIEKYTENRFYVYDGLFPVDLKIDTNVALKFLQFVESNSDKDLEILRGKIVGLLAINTPYILFQRMTTYRRNDWTKDQFLGILGAIWIYLINNIEKKIETVITNFVDYCLFSKDKETSFLALGIALRFYFDNSMNLRKSIKKYYHRSLENKLEVCYTINKNIAFIKDERFVSYSYNNLYKDIIQSESVENTIKFSYLLVELIEFRKTFSVVTIQNKHQDMIKKLVFKFVKNNWWDVIEIDDLLFHFGLIDIETNGKNLKRLLRMKKGDPNLFFFPQLILNTLRFNIILVDLLNNLRTKYKAIFLPTLSLLLKKISEEFENTLRSYATLIKEISEKIKEPNKINEVTNLQALKYEDVILNNKQLSLFIKKLDNIEFDNKYNEIKYFSNESVRISNEMMGILDLFSQIEPIIIQASKSAWWIDMTSILKKIYTSTIYQKIILYQYLILDLQNPREKVDTKKVRKNFDSFPLISKFFTNNWLNLALKNNLTHPLIHWLNSMDIQNLDDNSPTQEWPLMNVLNLEHSLSYFEKIDDQGKSTIMKELKKENNFFDALVHLQLAKKIKQLNKYEPILEEKINGKPVDLLIKINGLKIIVEVTSIDMYQPLKYSSDVVEIRDKVLEKLTSKTKYTGKIRNLTNAIVLVIDTTRSPESDLKGLIDAIRGYKRISRLFVVQGQHIRGTDDEQPETSFTDIPESKNISAMICLKTIIENNDTKFFGHIIVNKKAKYQIPMESLKELGEAIFTNENCIVDINNS